jgi:predicted metal-dependent phosphoesterase TrpH
MLLSGIALATITDATPARAPIRVDGYEILSGDFHVHAFVGDGGIPPWTMQRHAARAGLDVLAITNHNQTLAGRLGRWGAQPASGPLIIPGEEITGRDFHLIAVGIEQAVDWDQPVRAAIEQVHAQGGVAIAAHPLHGFAEGYDEVALAGLDGLEAAHPDSLDPTITPQFEEFYERTLARNPEVAAIGSSDFHMNGPLGACRTYLFVRERSQAGVLDAIRDGRTVGRCKDERLRGRAELVRLLEPHRDRLAPPRDALAPRFATFIVWLSLVALAVLGPR